MVGATIDSRQNYKHGSCVYIAGIIMQEFLGNDELFEGLFGVLEQFVQTTFSIVGSVGSFQRVAYCSVRAASDNRRESRCGGRLLPRMHSYLACHILSLLRCSLRLCACARLSSCHRRWPCPAFRLDDDPHPCAVYSLLQFGSMAILLAHTKANAIVSDFLYGFLASYRRKEGEESEGLSRFNIRSTAQPQQGCCAGPS